MLKRTVALLLLLVLGAFCFAGCDEDEGVPEGMYSVTLEGEPFILYVPGSWTDNRDSGISSAYLSVKNGVTVAARYYTVGDTALDDFVKQYVDSVKDSDNYKETEEGAYAKKTSLGTNKDARKHEYTFDRVSSENGVDVKSNVTVIQYFAKSGSNVIMLSFYGITEQLTDEYLEMFAQIRKEFVICEGSKVSEKAKTDKKTPDGMKIASFDSAQYVFYVPMAWECSLADKLSEAHTPDNKANVTVTAYALESEKTAEEYFAECEKSYELIKGYEKLGEPTERKVGGRDALCYTYKAKYGESEYKIMQTVFEYNSQMYSVTYTAAADVFDTHTEAVNKMLDAFRFR